MPNTARVTVEDCVTKVPNRFDLVLVSSNRARQISAGETMTVEEDRDKYPVIALRELAEGTIEPDKMMESVILGMQRHVEIDEPEEDEMAAKMLSQMFSDDIDPDAAEAAD